jgi:NADH-quinone oxidoreductase subunit J
MEINNFVFVLLSVITLLCAMGVVLVKNPIHSGLYLVLTMFSIAGHYVLLSAQFVAVVNIIVYAGAVMVLLLFEMMLLNLNKENEPLKSFKVKMLGAIVSGMLLVSMVAMYKVKMTTHSMAGIPVSEDFGYVKPLGNLLFTKYVFPFELSSILFLAAIVGAVFLGNRNKIEQ